MVEEYTEKPESCLEPHPGPERRRHRRYAIRRPLQFKIRNPDSAGLAGCGTSVNMSSTGLLFRSDKALTPGENIAAIVDWRCTAEAAAASLLLRGQVIWCPPPCVAMSISRHDFISAAVSDEVTPVAHSRRAELSGPLADQLLPLILVVGDPEVHLLVASIMKYYPTQLVEAEAAVGMLRCGRPHVGLLITNTLKEFAALDLSIPVLHIAGGREPAPGKVAKFRSITVIHKPLVYGQFCTQLRQLTQSPGETLH